MFNQPTSSMPPISPPQPTIPGAPARPSIAPSGAAKLEKSVRSSLVKTIAIILLSLLLVGALLLAVYFYNEYEIAQADVDSQVASALIAREKEITDELEAKFTEREKEPYQNFTGPDDYGAVSFKYPKTWSVYVAKDAVRGGDFEAYFYPMEVPPISNDTVFSLRVNIKSESFEAADNRYKGLVTSGRLTSSVITLHTATANRYDGTLPNNLIGSIVIFKIRDKTITLETDAEIYREDFAHILESVTFNE